MTQETFLNHNHFRWLWIHLALLVVLTIGYLLYQPTGGPNGGTVLGYTYGVIATIGILYLMWFGIRKRSYYSGSGSLKGWLAVHVWLGIALTFIVPLHSGFSFGLNVHTLAYVLMVLTIISGIWGAINYVTMPTRIGSNRGGATVREIVEQIEAVSADLQSSVGAAASDSFLKLLLVIADVPGGLVMADEAYAALARIIGNRLQIEVWVRMIDRHETASLLADIPEDERDQAMRLITTVNRKIELINQLQSEVRVMFWLKAWLYFHVPLAFALLAAVAIHIFSVFYFW